MAPIFHKLIIEEAKINLPMCVLNIGGISNITIIKSQDLDQLTSRDIGPGNCLIDEWVRKNSKNKFDKNGALSSIGKINQIIIEQAQDLFSNIQNHKMSLDTKDFDISFARGLSLEDGAATLTEFTAQILSAQLIFLLEYSKKNLPWRVLISGGGRKNEDLLKKMKEKMPQQIILQKIDDFKIDGDFVESQAFAYLAIRSYKSLPISFPKTTGCSKPSTGGVLIKY